MKFFKKAKKTSFEPEMPAAAVTVASAKVEYTTGGFVPLLYGPAGEAVPCAVDRRGWIVGTGRRVLYAATRAAAGPLPPGVWRCGRASGNACADVAFRCRTSSLAAAVDRSDACRYGCVPGRSDRLPHPAVACSTEV